MGGRERVYSGCVLAWSNENLIIKREVPSVHERLHLLGAPSFNSGVQRRGGAVVLLHPHAEIHNVNVRRLPAKLLKGGLELQTALLLQRGTDDPQLDGEFVHR